MFSPLKSDFPVLNLAKTVLFWDQTKHHWWASLQQFCLFFIFSLKRVVGAEHCTDTAADPRPRVCQLAVCTSCGRVTKPERGRPTDRTLPTVNGRLSVQPTHTLRRDQPAHTHSCSTRTSQPADVPEGRPTQIRVRPLKTLYLPTRPRRPLS